MIVMGAVSAAFVGSAQVASADPASWYSYPGFQSTWHCNTTGSYNLGSQGWAYVQACEVLNGQYYQGLVNVSFSQAHSNVVISVANNIQYDPIAGGGDYDGRTCNGSFSGGSNGIRTCFAHTEYPISDTYGAGAHVTGFVVDGVGIDLTNPATGPAQDYSPGVG